MNKLEKYRDKEAKSISLNKTHDDVSDVIIQAVEYGAKHGFDAALALNLSIKFANWLEEEWNNKSPLKSATIQLIIVRHYGHRPSIKELYKYWLDNVYNSEENL